MRYLMISASVLPLLFAMPVLAQQGEPSAKTMSSGAKIIKGLELWTAKQKAAADKEMEDRMKQALDIGEKLKTAFLNIAITLGPMIDKVAAAAQSFADFMAMGGGAVGKILLVVAGFGLLLKLIPGIGLLTTIISGLAVKMIPLGTGGLKAGRGMMHFGRGMAFGLKPLSTPLSLIAIGALSILFLSIGYAAKHTATIALNLGATTKSLITMAEAMHTLVDLDFESSLGTLGPSLKQAQKDLEDITNKGGKVKIINVLENLALIKTGKSAQIGTASRAAMSGLENFGDQIKDSLKDLLKGTEVTLRLDEGSTDRFWKKKHVKATLE